MNATKIQKNFLKERNLKKEKKNSFLKLKKARDNIQLKTFSINEKKRLKNKLILEKNEKQKKTIVDEISLETDSTIITVEEESNFQNEEMIKYINETELVLKDIYSKGIHLKIFNDLIKTKNEGQIQEKIDNVKFSTECLKNCINSLSYSEKINLILDIDETLVFSKIVKELTKEEESKYKFEDSPKDDLYYIKIESKNKLFIYKVQVRKNMTYFFKKLNPYCHFYINTMAGQLYVSHIINILYKNYGLELCNINGNNTNNIIYTSPQNKKTLPQEITKNQNFLILDDNICAWEVAYIPSIIPIQKFRGIFEKNNEIKNIFYQYYLFTNKIYCFDEKRRPFFDKDNNIPYCVEITKNEKSQLHYICEIIKKSILLSKLINIPVRHSLHFIQNTILKDCFIYYDGYDKEYIFDIINLLGGAIVKDIKNATHIIFNKNILNDNKTETNCDNKYSLDIKWIFDCFFNYKRCNEYSHEYKL